MFSVRICRVCHCTDLDCSDCIRRTGAPCWWVEEDLCSACVILTPSDALDLDRPGVAPAMRPVVIASRARNSRGPRSCPGCRLWGRCALHDGAVAGAS